MNLKLLTFIYTYFNLHKIQNMIRCIKGNKGEIYAKKSRWILHKEHQSLSKTYAASYAGTSRRNEYDFR